MTCIVGIENNGHVMMAGDIQGTGYNNKIVHTQSKVFVKKGIAFGYTTSYRFGQILEHNLGDPVVPDDSDDIYRWLITTLIPDIKRALKSADYEKGGTCLIGVKNQLWEMQDDFSVLRSKLGYASCGSGYEYAMGSMFTSISFGMVMTKSAAAIILKDAIKAAGTFSPSVGTESILVMT